MNRRPLKANNDLRIAFIAPYPASAVLPSGDVKPKYRGTEHPATWVRTLSQALIRIPGVKLRVFVDSRAVGRRHRVEVDGVDFTFVPKREPIRSDPLHGYVPGACRIRLAMSNFKPDIVQGFGIEGGCASIATLLPYCNVVFIQGIIEKTVEFRNIHPLRLASYIRNERSVLMRANGLITETAFAKNWVTGHNPKAHVQVIPHAMDRAYLDCRPAFDHESLLCVGSLNRIKGPDTVIRAFARTENINARLLLAGDGFLLPELQQLAHDLNISDRVDFLGHQSRDQLMKLMQHTRGLVLGSRMDTSPNVVTEAHAAALPVIGTRTGGIPDMVHDHQDGFLVPVDDDAAMAEKMDRLLAFPDEGRAMGSRGRNKVLTLNDPVRIAHAHLEFYHHVIRRQATLKLRRHQPIQSITRSPLARKAASLIPLAMRMGRTYWYWRHFLLDAQHWSKDQIEAWQLQRIQEMVSFAYHQTTGYRQLYDQAGAKPEDIRTMDDFRRLPFVTKELLRDNLERFSTNAKSRRYATTGGSTGIPLGFYHGNVTRQMEHAFMHSCWSWAGWKLGTPSAVLRGGYIGSEKNIAKYDPYSRELHLSSYFLSATQLPRYMEAIQRHHMKVLQAYPSSLNLLCDLLKQNNPLPAWNFDLILLGSENIYDWQLDKFRAVFPSARIFGWYGQAEQVILAPWCEHSRRYHARPFYSCTELLNEHDRPVTDGAEGELVGTNFHNIFTPFIRYRTMDRAVRGGSFCPDCGRQFMVMDRIMGRAHEVIVTKSGRYISMTAINMHDDTFDGIRQFQFYQDQPGKVVFRYVAAAPLGIDALQRIRSSLQAKLGGDTELSLKAVNKISRTRSGKFRFLEQHLSIQYGDQTS